NSREFSVPDSTGEGQALSLAFISAIAAKAMEKRQTASFPLVIDSQFGSLDKNYHRRIMKALPAHVGQVILVQTKTQWSAEMREAVKERVGTEIVLTRRVQSPVELVSEDGVQISSEEEVDLESGSFPYVEAGATDSTLIRQPHNPE
ncbi:MAG TPA: hypothetical protein VFF73_14155, partial [Planctomycetota bacterium]|nr:hypothetical protein [Planctomycetota bacterium]